MPQTTVPKTRSATARPRSANVVVDNLFFVFGGVSAVWLAWIALTESFSWGWFLVLFFVLFWVLLAYLVLPRLHRILTSIYVPDYFIGPRPHQRRTARRPDQPRADRLGGPARRGDVEGGLDARRRDHAEVQLAHHRVDPAAPQLRRGAGEPAVPVRAPAGHRLPAGGAGQSRPSVTTCGSGAARTAGCSPAGTRPTGWRPAPSTERSASRCSLCRSPTRSTRTPTSNATTSSRRSPARGRGRAT